MLSDWRMVQRCKGCPAVHCGDGDLIVKLFILRFLTVILIHLVGNKMYGLLLQWPGAMMLAAPVLSGFLDLLKSSKKEQV